MDLPVITYYSNNEGYNPGTSFNKNNHTIFLIYKSDSSMFPADFLKTTPHSSGIYLMLDKKSAILYVGKAKDLQKRNGVIEIFDQIQNEKVLDLLQQHAQIEDVPPAAPDAPAGA